MSDKNISESDRLELIRILEASSSEFDDYLSEETTRELEVLYEQVEKMTPAERDEALRAAGMDPQELRSDIQKMMAEQKAKLQEIDKKDESIDFVKGAIRLVVEKGRNFLEQTCEGFSVFSNAYAPSALGAETETFALAPLKDHDLLVGVHDLEVEGDNLRVFIAWINEDQIPPKAPSVKVEWFGSSVDAAWDDYDVKDGCVQCLDLTVGSEQLAQHSVKELVVRSIWNVQDNVLELAIY